MTESEKTTIYDYLELIEETSSTIEKEIIIGDMLTDCDEAEEFLRMTFNGAVYGIKEQSFYNAFERYEGQITKSYPHISNFFIDSSAYTSDNQEVLPISFLKDIVSNLLKYSGDQALQFLYHEFEDLNPVQAKWWSRCILHDLRMGANLKTINSVFKSKGLKEIPKFEMMLANKIDVMDDDEICKIKLPCAIETKYDGIRIQAEKWHDEVTLTSRRGTDNTEKYPDIVEAIRDAFKSQDHVILDGEIIRLADSGAGHSFQQLMRKDADAKRRYVVFDLLMQEDLDYNSRWDNLFNLFLSCDLISDSEPTEVTENQLINNNIPKNTSANTIILANHTIAYTYQEIQDFYLYNIDAKAEGIMLKVIDAPYKRGKRTEMWKCKPDYVKSNRAANEADLLIVGWKYGSGANHDKVGTLELQDANGLRVDVGSGINDWWRHWLTEKKDELVGMICEIRYNEKTETGSLRFPRFIRIREDKDTPDTISSE